MKNKFLLKSLLIFAFVAIVLSAYIVSTLEIRKLTKAKVTMEDSLKLVSEKINDRLIEIQKLSAENRIVKMAVDSLKMEYNNEGMIEINLSKNKIKSLEKRLNSIYE
jgi:cell division protein FtsL